MNLRLMDDGMWERASFGGADRGLGECRGNVDCYRWENLLEMIKLDLAGSCLRLGFNLALQLAKIYVLSGVFRNQKGLQRWKPHPLPQVLMTL